eukprot:Rmarinus@m.27927
MGPKKGKGGKKKKKKRDKEAERREAERLEQERLERERLEQERLEKERKIREEEERRLAEERRIKREEELKRLQEEISEDRVAIKERGARIRVAVEKDREAEEWDRFVDNSHRPMPTVEAEVNTFLTTLVEDEAREMDPVMCQIKTAEEVAQLIDDQLCDAMEWGEESPVEKYQRLLYSTWDMQNRLMDRMSAHIVQYSDEHINDLNPDIKVQAEGAPLRGDVKLAAACPCTQFGLWINLEKRSRTKFIEYPDVDIVLEIPKSLAMQSVAIRAIHQLYNHESFKFHNEHFPLGGVISVDLLALPPPPKQVKEWTLREVTYLATDVQRLPYPIPPAGVDLSINETNLNAPPMRVSFALAPRVILQRGDDDLKVGWWDHKSNDWSSAGVSDVKYDPAKRVISFLTCRLSTTFALLQARVMHYPYKSWFLRPIGENTHIVSVVTDINETVEIKVHNGKCTLLAPPHEELADLRSASLSPLRLLKRLQQCGMNLLPEEADAKFLKGLVMKSMELDDKAYLELAMIAPSYVLQNSKWNQGFGADRCLVLAKECLDYADRSMRVDESWVSVMVDFEKVAILKAKETEAECNEDLVDGETTHLDSIRAVTGGTLKGGVEATKGSAEGFERILTADPKHVESLHHLLKFLRVLSLV